ncbi:hypothetical protein WJX82_006711 [Trebouxia sp. C0006]
MQCTATARPVQLHRSRVSRTGIPSTSISFKPFSSGHIPRRHSQRSEKVLRRGFGKDTVEGWIDLSKLVSGSGGIKTAFEDLSYKIGHDVYIDVSGWHLFLREVKAAKGLNLAQALAQQFGQDISSKKYNKSTFEEVLKKVPIKLGGGKAQLPLMDLLPSGCVQDLEGILEDFERDS